jgi:hypothetical protein
MSDRWVALRNNVSDSQAKAEVEQAIRLGLGQRENPEISIAESGRTLVVSVKVAGNMWRSKQIDLHNREPGTLQSEIIQPLQRWATAGFPDWLSR